MQVHGTIKSISETQTVSDRFKKREFVVTTEENTPYPQTVLFEMNQDKCDVLNQYKEGQEVSVDFNIRGRQWTDPQGAVKTFNTLQAWRIQLVNGNNNNQQQQNNNTNAGSGNNNNTSPAFDNNSNNDNDDLPF